MLNIILGKNNKPNSNYIEDVEKGFMHVGIPNTELSRYLLKELEQAEYLGITEFIDRYGFKLRIDCMSTGMKALLCIAYSGKIVNGLEIGQNAFELMIQSVDGNVYFDNVNRFQLPEFFEVENITVNGESYKTVLELENALWKE